MFRVEQTTFPKDTKKCEQQLRFLDFLRKSQCTPYTSWKGDATLQNASGCLKTLKQMEIGAKKCLEAFNDTPPQPKIK